MKTRKAPVADDITSELIKNAGFTFQDELFILISDIYITGEISEDVMRNIIIPLPKKTMTKKCNNIRTLSLIVHATKIFVKIIVNRIKNEIEWQLINDQFGFRRNRGTREVILSLRIVIENRIKNNNDSFFTFID